MKYGFNGMAFLSETMLGITKKHNKSNWTLLW